MTQHCIYTYKSWAGCRHQYRPTQTGRGRQHRRLGPLASPAHLHTLQPRVLDHIQVNKKQWRKESENIEFQSPPNAVWWRYLPSSGRVTRTLKFYSFQLRINTKYDRLYNGMTTMCLDFHHVRRETIIFILKFWLLVDWMKNFSSEALYLIVGADRTHWSSKSQIVDHFTWMQGTTLLIADKIILIVDRWPSDCYSSLKN